MGKDFGTKRNQHTKYERSTSIGVKIWARLKVFAANCKTDRLKTAHAKSHWLHHRNLILAIRSITRTLIGNLMRGYVSNNIVGANFLSRWKNLSAWKVITTHEEIQNFHQRLNFAPNNSSTDGWHMNSVDSWHCILSDKHWRMDPFFWIED
jgi:hypothetical protein